MSLSKLFAPFKACSRSFYSVRDFRESLSPFTERICTLFSCGCPRQVHLEMYHICSVTLTYLIHNPSFNFDTCCNRSYSFKHIIYYINWYDYDKYILILERRCVGLWKEDRGDLMKTLFKVSTASTKSSWSTWSTFDELIIPLLRQKWCSESTLNGIPWSYWEISPSRSFIACTRALGASTFINTWLLTLTNNFSRQLKKFWHPRLWVLQYHLMSTWFIWVSKFLHSGLTTRF